MLPVYRLIGRILYNIIFTKEGSNAHQLFNIAQVVTDLEQLESDHGHNILYLDNEVDDILSGVDGLSHVVKDFIGMK